ncbi:FimV family protein, partial [Zhongshania aliphaticivorans]|uniref:type IV pilus assembly protein FimV n=1 Tax=Zhongshania aliphaticivorans TaxID=1470434 RepID=UPI0039C90614
MVRKRLATAVLVTGALHSGLASALGLGELTLSSALNQPFRAEIPLRDVGELDVEQIRIALADDTAFENAGVERSQFLSSLEFQVELQGGGNGRIIVTTTNTVQEPYLDFI